MSKENIYHTTAEHTKLIRYCNSMTRSSWEAEDLAQDTWLKAIQHDQGNRPEKSDAFLYRIARNTWIDKIRRQARLHKIMQQDLSSTKQEMNEGTIQLEIIFHTMIHYLTPVQRTVFMLRDVFGYTAKEASEHLGTTEGAVKAALLRGRQSILAVREELDKGGLPLPQEEGARDYLKAIAAAYMDGDVALLVRMVLSNEADSAVAVVQVQIKAIETRSINMSRRSDMFMAA
ncbi:RNA polymerase sigma factor [Paenibacillus swuensis]|uniref:RNA polymerase sigma factor n=1 Tax=Paenibacillus swuensis TaxID=1178515 RepID=UPI0008383465|nr:RNA polymerase sigma factor [Paenibacillus swuensis]